ncbi:MAG: NAD+ synthase [Rhodospirillaceae bacterium]|nr:NAD+ synthase [Rhodospirillaceae bacterium]
MTQTLTIVIAQTNPTVGSVESNIDQVKRLRSANMHADLIVFSELNISGYPPEDLILRQSFLDTVHDSISNLAKETEGEGPGLIIGAPWQSDSGCGNAALLIDDGKIQHSQFKHHLPNYGVFDEKRVFVSGDISGPVMFRGIRIGILICEDMWYQDVTETLHETAAEILIVINGSPFELDKNQIRLNHAVARVTETRLPLIYVNQVGGQDDLVFDGGSFVMNSDCSIAFQAPWWGESVFETKWSKQSDNFVCEPSLVSVEMNRLENIYQAMVLSLRDYISKNGFSGVVIGLSGGIDSALSAVVAADALGPDKVHTIMMPSPYTSQESIEDAELLAKNLRLKLDTIFITEPMQTFNALLKPFFGDRQADTTEENIQSRIRGLILMALSNKFGSMVLSTGNKSEVSVGYATLYGDMCGGYSVLKDIYKTTVFALCKWRNESIPNGVLAPYDKILPENIISKAPTAELRHDQKDEDSLPPYSELDSILKSFIENSASINDVVKNGHHIEVARKVWRLLKLSEYKRRQSAPGVKISQLAFGRDHRYPITNAFQGETLKRSDL